MKPKPIIVFNNSAVPKLWIAGWLKKFNLRFQLSPVWFIKE